MRGPLNRGHLHISMLQPRLKVVDVNHVWINGGKVAVRFTPTVPTCSVATLIGLTIKACRGWGMD